MVNRISRNTAREVDKLTPSDATAAREFIAKNLAFQVSLSYQEPVIDEVIAALVNAHENRRARQVTEWERMRGTHVQRTA